MDATSREIQNESGEINSEVSFDPEKDVFDSEKAVEAVHSLVEGEIIGLKNKWWIVEGVPKEEAAKVAKAVKIKLNGNDEIYAGFFAAVSGNDLLNAEQKNGSWESFYINGKDEEGKDKKLLCKKKHLVVDASGLKFADFWKLIRRFASRPRDHSIFLCKDYPPMPDSLVGTVTQEEMAGLNAGEIHSLSIKKKTPRARSFDYSMQVSGNTISWPEDLKIEEEEKLPDADELKKEKQRERKEGTRELGLQVINAITNRIINCLSGEIKDWEGVKKVFGSWETINKMPGLEGHARRCFIGVISEVNAYQYLNWLRNKKHRGRYLIECDKVVRATKEQDRRGVDLILKKDRREIPIQVKTLKRREGRGLMVIERKEGKIFMHMGLKEDTTGLEEEPVVMDGRGNVKIKEDERSRTQKLADLIWTDADCERLTMLDPTNSSRVKNQSASLIGIINGY